MTRLFAVVALALALVVPAMAVNAADDAAKLTKDIVKSATVLKSGVLESRARYEAAGHVDLAQVGDVFYIILREDFNFGSAPDPQLGFGKAGEKWAGNAFSSLNLNKGLQVYRLPAGLDPTEFEGFFVWCEKFSVPLAYAKFGATS